MKYTTIQKDQINWEFIYCNKAETVMAEDIAKVLDGYAGPFHAKDHIPEDCNPIKNDSRLFILKDMNDNLSILQVGGLASDFVGQTIPHVYKVRKIGYLYEDK